MSRKLTSRAVNHYLGGKLTAAHETHEIVQAAMVLYGDSAPTAVAWCALDAWCEADIEAYNFWLGVFRRLNN